MNLEEAERYPTRHLMAKTSISYYANASSEDTVPTTNGTAYHSSVEEVLNGAVGQMPNSFTLYDNDLSGEYSPISLYGGIDFGWTSYRVTESNKEFLVEPWVKVTLNPPRSIKTPVRFDFDKDRDVVPTKFIITVKFESESETDVFVTDHNLNYYEITLPAGDTLEYIIITFQKMSEAGYPAVIREISGLGQVTYNGDKIIRINTLEELEADDDTFALGSMSANELTLELSNVDGEFTYDSANWRMKKNRRIIPWLGLTRDNYQWWAQQGEFWSNSWTLSKNQKTVTVTAYDTLARLNTVYMSPTDSTVYAYETVPDIFEALVAEGLTKAGVVADTCQVLGWNFDNELVQYAWFEKGCTYAAAIKKLITCSPYYVYCRKDGTICLHDLRIRPEVSYQEWSEETNVTNTDFPSLFTPSVNQVNMLTHKYDITGTDVYDQDIDVTLTEGQIVSELYTWDDLPSTYEPTPTITFTGNVTASITSYGAWGCVVKLEGGSGGGVVSHLKLHTVCVVELESREYTYTNSTEIAENGVISKSVDHPFWKKSMTDLLGPVLLSRASYAQVTASVEYRGSLTAALAQSITLKEDMSGNPRKYSLIRNEQEFSTTLTATATLR